MSKIREGLTFDEESHTYKLHGQPIPGVTTVLSEFVEVQYGNLRFYVSTINGNVIEAEKMEAAGDYGRAVHKVMELTLLHGADAVYYPDRIKPAVDALMEWQRQWKPEIIAVEYRGASVKYGYAGTLDILCYLPAIKRLALVDAKTGLGILTGPQTAAYEKMWREETGERKIIDRYKLRLPKEGGGAYKMVPLKDPRDWTYFTHRLYGRQFLKQLKA